MSERDVIGVLAQANPVRVDDLPEMAFPDSILAPRRPRTRLIFAASAAVLAAGAAASIAVFAFGGPSSQSRTTVQKSGNSLIEGLAGPTVARPLAPGASAVSLADATAALGPALVLPDTSLIGPSDVGPVWMYSNGDESAVTVAVTFPKQGMFIDYLRPLPEGRATSYADVLAHYRAIAQDTPEFHVLDLNGVPALAADQDSDETGRNFGVVLFNAGGVEIRVLGHYDQETLRTVAQSILDRTGSSTPGEGGINLFPSFPPRKRIALRDASATLGAPVVLPTRSFVKPSDVRRVWAQGKCPPVGRHAACSIWMRIPAQSLTIIYQRPRPSWPRTRAQYEIEAKHMNMVRRQAEVIDLNGVPALAIDENVDGGRTPGWIYFAVGGTRIVVAGYRDDATLQAVARSIVDRARS